MKILHLPLKKEWYNMIESGVKTEEYRSITTHWIARLFRDKKSGKTPKLPANILASNPKVLIAWLEWRVELGELEFKPFDFVKFSYGYTKRAMTFEIKEIAIGKGKPEWGAPDEVVFIIKLERKDYDRQENEQAN